MVLGLLAAVPTGGLSLLGGALGGAVGGGLMGALFHKHLGISPEDSARIAREITGGKAAIGVLAEADEADAFAAMLVELGGQPESYELSPEGEETAAAALEAQEAAGSSANSQVPLPAAAVTAATVTAAAQQVEKPAATTAPAVAPAYRICQFYHSEESTYAKPTRSQRTFNTAHPRSSSSMA